MESGSQQGLDFLQLPPSQQWEPRMFAGRPDINFWIWLKPAHFPQGLVLLLPEQLPREDPAVQAWLTMRALMHQAGIPVEQVQTWSLNGMTFDGQQGTNPLLDQPVPPPVAGVDPGIFVALQAPMMYAPPLPAIGQGMPVMAAPVARTGISRPANPAELELLVSMQAEWTASTALENDLQRHRKMLVDMIGKLKGLNRDLNTDERTFSSSQDKKDWQDARRWLRDCSANLARCQKEYDIGFTSKAGQRTWFEETYENLIVPQKPFDNMEQAHADFQIYHKQLQTLLSSIKSGLQHASQNGERRAQRILATIAAKVREGNNRNSFLGVITGS